MTSHIGTRLGPYEIVAALGVGGMGEVYKARDTRLDRTVAVKVLSETLAADPQFRERFDREARAISQLTHPNICTLYDVGEYASTAYLVMELLEGETLEHRLTKGPLPLDQALKTAIEIASALDRAHRAGIIHRDLKPGNIMLTKGGAKLLDFGLAKATSPILSGAGLSMLPTTPPHLTAQGTILGTFQYMAPEQLEGHEADTRTDIFAFGAVLYEMLTGKKAFEGKSQASLIAAILDHDPPAISSVQPLTPTALDRLVKTCIAKDPDDRWQSARDLLRTLRWITEAPVDGSGVIKAQPLLWRRLARHGGTWLVGAAFAGTAVWLLKPTVEEPRQVTRFEAPLPTGTAFTNTGRHVVALSPDGSRLVFVANQQLYLRSMDQNDPLELRGTNLGASEPVFSPDGRWIAFWARNQFRKIALSGGAPVTLADTQNPYGASWTGEWIYFGAGANGIYRVKADGGQPEQVITVDAKAGEEAHGPQLLPGDDAVLFTLRTGGEWDDATIVVQSLGTSERHVIVRGGTDARFVETGHIVYGREGVLFAVPFDAERLQVRGGPVSLVDGVTDTPAGQTGSFQYALSASGALVYIPGAAVAQSTLAWVDRQGRDEPIPAPARNYFYPRLSPEGTRIAVDTHDLERDIWIWDLVRSTLTRLTFGRGEDFYPVWTPDGQRVVYSRVEGGRSSLFWRLANGTGGEERLTEETAHAQRSETISPDGKFVAILNNNLGRPQDLTVFSFEDRTIRPLVEDTGFNEGQAAFSPDGRWLAYQSNESGRTEVSVRPFPAVADGKWQISNGGGNWPLWSEDGRELFFRRTTDQRLMVTPVDTTGPFRAGTPTVLFDMTRYGGSAPGRPYDISSDGRKFLMVKTTGSADSGGRIQVVQNWINELRARVPAQ